MRTTVLFLLTVTGALAMGCGSEQRAQTTGSVQERDITLRPPPPAVEIVTAVERLQPARHPAPPRVRPAGRPQRQLRPPPADSQAVASVVPPAITAGAVAAEEPLSERELPPGKTITLIPASSGPSTGPNYTDEFYSGRSGTAVRVGARCPPRNRPGIGIATRPRPSLY